MPVFCLALILLLAACAPLPNLPGTSGTNLPVPQILPLDEVLAAAPAAPPQDSAAQTLAARAAALRARAAALRSNN